VLGFLANGQDGFRLRPFHELLFQFRQRLPVTPPFLIRRTSSRWRPRCSMQTFPRPSEVPPAEPRPRAAAHPASPVGRQALSSPFGPRVPSRYFPFPFVEQRRLPVREREKDDWLAIALCPRDEIPLQTSPGLLMVNVSARATGIRISRPQPAQVPREATGVPYRNRPPFRSRGYGVPEAKECTFLHPRPCSVPSSESIPPFREAKNSRQTGATDPESGMSGPWPFAL